VIKESFEKKISTSRSSLIRAILSRDKSALKCFSSDEQLQRRHFTHWKRIFSRTKDREIARLETQVSLQQHQLQALKATVRATTATTSTTASVNSVPTASYKQASRYSSPSSSSIAIQNFTMRQPELERENESLQTKVSSMNRKMINAGVSVLAAWISRCIGKNLARSFHRWKLHSVLEAQNRYRPQFSENPSMLYPKPSTSRSSSTTTTQNEIEVTILIFVAAVGGL